MFSHLIQGLSTALLLGNLFYLVLGVTGGVVIGALPGLTATMGVAILLPFTFGMDAVTGLIMLVGIYIGAILWGIYLSYSFEYSWNSCISCYLF